MIEGFIGRPGGKLRSWLRVISAVGATALSVFAGTMMLAAASAAAAEPPVVVYQIVPYTTAFEARVEAVVTPNEQTECHIEYGTTTVGEHKVPCEQPTIEGGEQVVGQTLTGLSGATEYKFQFVLKNVASEVATGIEEHFKTEPVEAPQVLEQLVPWVTTLKARVEAVVDPDNQNSKCHIQYGKTTVTEKEVSCEQALLEVPSGPQVVGQTLSGLEAATTYHYQFVLKNTSNEENTPVAGEFKTEPAEAPSLVTETEAWTGAFEARLEATVNPDNQDSECHVKYGKTTVTEKTVPCEQATIEVPSGEQGVGVTLTGLEAGTKYKYTFLLKNTSGEETALDEQEFETAALKKPTVISQSASTKPFEATLSATINPNGQDTDCHVDYGETTVTEHEAPCEPEKLEAPFSEAGVNVTLTGLNSATKYHFQFVLKNQSGEDGSGVEETFETVAPVSQVETGVARAIKMTSAELTGQLNAGGEATYYFEYGTSPCVTTPPASCGEQADVGALSGRAVEAVTPALLEFPTFIGQPLKPSTTYHYWLVGTNGALPEPVHGEEKEFTTLDVRPSQIDVGNVEDITTTSAVINGAINPGGINATVYIEYGSAQCSGTSCGQKTAAVPVSGETQAAITPISITHLEPNTVYHFWLVVNNNGVSEPVHGQADAFKTAATKAQVEAEEAAEKAASAQSGAAAKSKLEEETRHREEAVAALTAAQNKKYNEINAVLATTRLQEEALAKTEAIIAATSVEIVKTRVTTAGVVVTFQVSQAGNVAVTGTGLQKQKAKLSVGTHTITVKLTKAGKADRKGHKKATITVTLDTALTSVSSSTSLKL